ncbi:biotin/lipoyl-containing protein [Saltatorellus ferox]|uniref:biotin/lipoyl-containing protein n=1 Tax=Saltatorellus ferox TaxID=2528018 RepID=UPI003AF353B9
MQPLLFLAAVALIFTTSGDDRAWPWLVAVMVVNHLVDRLMEPTADQVSSEYSRLRAMKRLKLLKKELDEQRGPVFRGGGRPIWRPAPEGRLQLVAAAQGDGSRSVAVVRWMVEPGAIVTETQPIAHVQYDAATLEFPADRAGRICELLVPAGREVPIDTVLCELEPDSLPLTTPQEAPAA